MTNVLHQLLAAAVILGYCLAVAAAIYYSSGPLNRAAQRVQQRGRSRWG